MGEASDYRTDSEYIYHYLDWFSPQFMRFSLLLEGYDAATPASPPDGRPYRYLELGFGRGVSLNIHAAANAGEYWGVDFLPVHAEQAREMADASGANLTILDKTFAEADAMAAEGRLPRVDAVVLHGVWSWVNDANRKHLLAIVDRVLEPGGVVYLNYNAMPGWDFFAPVRDLMMSALGRYGEGTDIGENIRDMLSFLIAFRDTGEVEYFNRNPLSARYLDELAKMPPEYIAGEFLNASWEPFYFRRVAGDMAGLGCRFAGSTQLLAQSPAAVRPKAAALVSVVVDPVIREAVRDFAVDRKLRADLFVRNPRRLTPREQLARLADERLMLLKPRGEVSLEVRVGDGTVTLMPELFNPVLDNLARDGGAPRTVREAFGDALVDSKDGPRILVDCLRLLVGNRIVHLAGPEPSPETVAACRRLNRELCRRKFERGIGGAVYLASPVLGAGAVVPESVMLLMRCLPEGSLDVENWARAAALEQAKATPGTDAGAAADAMRDTIERWLPDLRRLGIVDGEGDANG